MVRTVRDRLAGWPIVGWCVLVLVTLMAAILGVEGVNEPGLRALVRSTAQTSFVLFSSAFGAAALCATWPGPLTRWMLRNRRYLGVSFAVSHVLHLIALVALALFLGDRFKVNAATLVGGGIAYVFIAAMTATSFDRTAAWLGPRRWRRLHTTGAYYIWFIFFSSYAPRAVASLWYAPFVLLLLGVLVLRVVVLLRRRQRAPAVAAVLR
jgi:methionine sulfoxide reductase heme-binding subunit